MLLLNTSVTTCIGIKKKLQKLVLSLTPALPVFLKFRGFSLAIRFKAVSQMTAYIFNATDKHVLQGQMGTRALADPPYRQLSLVPPDAQQPWGVAHTFLHPGLPHKAKSQNQSHAFHTNLSRKPKPVQGLVRGLSRLQAISCVLLCLSDPLIVSLSCIFLSVSV